jgi:hypothetical protein
MAAQAGTLQAAAPVRLDDVRELVGDIAEVDAAAIIATGASRAELEQAVYYARGYGGIVQRSGLPLVGAAAQIYEILAPYEEDDDPRR